MIFSLCDGGDPTGFCLPVKVLLHSLYNRGDCLNLKALAVSFRHSPNNGDDLKKALLRDVSKYHSSGNEGDCRAERRI